MVLNLVSNIYNSPSSNNTKINWNTGANNNQNTTGQTIYNLQGIQNFLKQGEDINNIAILDRNSTGSYTGGAAQDIAWYQNSIGTKDTYFDGGAGNNDGVAINGNTQDIINTLKQSGYIVKTSDNGFSFITPEGQELTFANIEQIIFNDKTFNLLNSDDVKLFVNALTNSGVPIIDKKNNPLNGLTNNQYCNNSNYNYNNQPYIVIRNPNYNNSSNPYFNPNYNKNCSKNNNQFTQKLPAIVGLLSQLFNVLV